MELKFTNKEISAWGGLSILKKMLDKSGFLTFLSEVPLPVQGSNRGHDPIQLIVQFMSSVWCGANRYSHLDVMRFDTTILKLFGWGKKPEHKAFQRYFNKFNIGISSVVFEKLYTWFFTNLHHDNFTLDIDSSVLTRYGEQQAANKGYNKSKPGRNSHHPLMAFISDFDIVANFWLRPGNSSASNNFQAFLEETLRFIKDKKVGLLRLDSGFYDQKIFQYLETTNPLNYIVATPMYTAIQRKIHAQNQWVEVEKGLDIVEFQYQAKEWEHSRRMIAVRRLLKDHPKSVGKQLSLFADEIEINGYRYTCYITSLDLPMAEVWRLYRGRANCENKIKELKYDYGLDKINEQSFDATEATLRFMTIAYNLMSLFKLLVINSPVKNRLSTLRHKLLAIPATITQKGDKIIIEMALQMQRRAWIKKLWDTEVAFKT